MRKRPVDPSPYFLPSRAFIEYLPKGVIAVIAPWNYPVNLALAPATAVRGGEGGCVRRGHAETDAAVT